MPFRRQSAQPERKRDRQSSGTDREPSVVDKIRTSLQRGGLRETKDLIVKNIDELVRKYVKRSHLHQDRDFDVRFGTDTSAAVELRELQIPSENRRHGGGYRPTFEKLFREIMTSLPIKHEDYVFIDFGSGKGKALLLASDLPFKRIIGIEFSPELHQIAERNFRIYRSPQQRCSSLQSICIDATQFRIPNDPCVLYFYNPFDEQVMARTIQNIEASMSRHFRPLCVVYVNPLCGFLFDSKPWLEKVAATDRWSVYNARQGAFSPSPASGR